MERESAMKRTIDIETWNRKEHFEFFGNFEEPIYGITADVECTGAYKQAKETGGSFFLLYLHCSLAAVNRVEALRIRVEEGQPVVYDRVHAASTIGRPDNTFGMSFIPYEEDFAAFEEHGKREIARVQSSPGLAWIPETGRSDVIHYSAIPWIKFTSVSHVRNFSRYESVPKISFGKTYTHDNRLYMPVSVHVNHGLVDGYHISQYLETFETLMNP